MTMAEMLKIHGEIENADRQHAEDFSRAFADAVNLALDMYLHGEIRLDDLDKVTTEFYKELA